jgi:K+-sensing histidine kinase KdpD
MIDILCVVCLINLLYVLFYVLAIMVFDHFFITPVYALQYDEQNNSIKRSPISPFQKPVSTF